VLELINIHTYYGDSYVLQGISLKVQEGSVVALLGRNGMGKTTTIRSIIGFTPPRRGELRFKGKDIMHLSSHEIAQMGIGLVPQGRRIFPSLNVKENLTMAAQPGRGNQRWSLDRVYSYFPILKDRSNLKGNLLSGGEQQMLAIARALMTNPDLLLMDEPSEGLAPTIVLKVGEIISQLKESGFSILLVEQNYPMALKEQGVDFALDNRHLWIRMPSQWAILRIRAVVIRVIREWLDTNGFTGMDTPILTPAACEGTTTLFETPYFDEGVAYLAQSGQLYNEADIIAFSKVYCFGPTFRAEKSKTRRHLTEFWMVEPEAAFCDLDQLMEIEEQFVSYIVKRVLEQCAPELKSLKRDTSKLEKISPPFPRISYDDAVKKIEQLRNETDDPEKKELLKIAEICSNSSFFACDAK